MTIMLGKVEVTMPRRGSDLEIDELWSSIGAEERRRRTSHQFDCRRRKVVALVNVRRADAARVKTED